MRAPVLSTCTAQLCRPRAFVLLLTLSDIYKTTIIITSFNFIRIKTDCNKLI